MMPVDRQQTQHAVLRLLGYLSPAINIQQSTRNYTSLLLCSPFHTKSIVIQKSRQDLPPLSLSEGEGETLLYHVPSIHSNANLVSVNLASGDQSLQVIVHSSEHFPAMLVPR